MAPATVAGVSKVRPGGSRATSREHIIERIRRWVELYGEPPRLADWNPGQAKATGQLWRIDRYRAGDPATGAPWPSANAARRPFAGSLEAAIRAAGFEPARRGPRPRSTVDLRRVSEVRLTPEQRATVDAALAAARDAERRARAAEADARRSRTRVARTEDDLAAARRENARLRRRSGRPAPAAQPKTKVVRVKDEAARERAAEARRAATRLASRLERAEATIASLRAERRELAEEARAATERIAALERSLAAARARRPAVARSAAVPAELTLARRQASAAERRAQRLERELLELSAAVSGAPRRLTVTELAELRASGPSGPAVLAAALEHVARARRDGDRIGLAAALRALAGAAVAWEERL